MNISVAGTFQQSPNGSITEFTTAGNIAPNPNTMIVWDNFPLVPNVGFTVSGFQVTFSVAPGATDNLYWQGFITS